MTAGPIACGELIQNRATLSEGASNVTPVNAVVEESVMSKTMPREPRLGEIFAAASERMLAQHVTDAPGSMLRAPAITTRGRVYAFATKASVIVKLPADRVSALIEAGVGAPCTTGKAPLREWVCLEPSDEDECLEYFVEARRFVGAF
jgi:hypothetical protein